MLQTSPTVQLQMSSSRSVQASMRISASAGTGAQGVQATSAGLYVKRGTIMGARVLTSGATTIPLPQGLGLATAIPFDSVNQDYTGLGGTPSGMVNLIAYPTRLTCQRAGYYAIGGSAFVSNNQNSQYVSVAWLQKNGGANRIGRNQVFNGNAAVNSGGQVNAVEFLNVGDYIELYAAVQGPAADPGDLRLIDDGSLYAFLLSE